ncbi:MAG: energy transducer TonB [Bacteroidota bacterium]|nr:energy transducer TonB [Bacteroidota bacterium]
MKTLCLLFMIGFTCCLSAQEDSLRGSIKVQKNVPLDSAEFLRGFRFEPVLTIVEQMPEFIDKDGMKVFIEKNLKKPTMEVNGAVKGTVYLSLTIEPNGTVSRISMLKGVMGCSSCNKEAIRVAGLMSKWKPGFQNGIAQRVNVNIPFEF